MVCVCGGGSILCAKQITVHLEVCAAVKCPVRVCLSYTSCLSVFSVSLQDMQLEPCSGQTSHPQPVKSKVIGQSSL